MIAKVIFNIKGHFQTKYHSTEMNIIKLNINKKDFPVCSMLQNCSISQFQYMKLLPGLVAMVTMKHFLLYQGLPDNC